MEKVKCQKWVFRILERNWRNIIAQFRVQVHCWVLRAWCSFKIYLVFKILSIKFKHKKKKRITNSNINWHFPHVPNLPHIDTVSLPRQDHAPHCWHWVRKFQGTGRDWLLWTRFCLIFCTKLCRVLFLPKPRREIAHPNSHECKAFHPCANLSLTD